MQYPPKYLKKIPALLKVNPKEVTGRGAHNPKSRSPLCIYSTRISWGFVVP